MADTDSTNAAWGGRFSAPTDEFVAAFTASVGFDKRLAPFDIQGSIAHAKMLAHCHILTDEEAATIIGGLNQVLADIDAGHFQWDIAREDVHMNVEAALVDRIGELGKKLHTARSRNDQVATDIRLFLRNQIDELLARLEALLSHLVDLAEREASTIMPGFTHLQAAQPVTFGHHMLAWFEMLMRDRERLHDCRTRVNQLPLGAGALAGTTFPIDRVFTADLLGFEGVARNSLDAVSDRDFAIEFTAVAALIMVHYSRMAEELIIWNSQQFAFVELSDAFCTGSSMMPQKKNPDVPELIRGKSGRVIGHLMNLLTLMKGQPLAYNKDNQEDKEPLFDTVDTLLDCTRAYSDLIPTIEIRTDALQSALAAGLMNATELADYLVRKGRPFRDAHETVGRAVRLAIEAECALEALPLSTLRSLDEAIEEDVFQALDLEQAVAARDHLGGTAPAQVREACSQARARLGNH
ncbi:MAG: argininosuccinate lyase [Pseudomonadota bacterium]